MRRKSKETCEERNRRRDVAFERGWADSLRGYFALSMQSMEDCYDYGRGWSDCATYRWADPRNRGIAPDSTYRPVTSGYG